MKIGGRYKLIGKRKHAILDLPYAQVCETFENMLINSDVTRLMGSVNRNTGVFKIEYKIHGRQKDTYETYCMLVELTETAAIPLPAKDFTHALVASGSAISDLFKRMR